MSQRAGAWCGIAALVCYFGGAFAPLPDPVVRLLGLAFGPLLAVSFLGIWIALKVDADGLALRTGVLFGVVASGVVTTLISIQLGNRIWRDRSLAEASGADQEETARLIWESVNRVQALMDVAWDVFLSVGAALIAASLLRSPRFRAGWGWAGLLFSVLLLGLNLYTFPDGPAYAGLVDAGPLLALWFGALFILLLRLPVSAQHRHEAPKPESSDGR